MEVSVVEKQSMLNRCYNGKAHRNVVICKWEAEDMCIAMCSLGLLSHSTGQQGNVGMTATAQWT